ncbi:SusC/RagA family TonB-linked outer membrane protein [Niastella caeni]|uniref:SusC/RagA family TonB-linked outer membrane protein n=1 Tax=Niastella caeni TaxID=2569763 RepID=A0A4V4H009_9BACT|nr:SusC/RagA family TonB-linked outer membrane protein [Niastella caeni]THU34736.1 SusC/RagA family TonB-linked outer membrane protein [Niastella caeni]
MNPSAAVDLIAFFPIPPFEWGGLGEGQKKAASVGTTAGCKKVDEIKTCWNPYLITFQTEGMQFLCNYLSMSSSLTGARKRGPGKPKRCFNPGIVSRQILLTMKLTAILLTVVFLQVKADGLSQTVTFSGKDVPLKQVFTAIEKQTGYIFFYNLDIWKDAKPVTIKIKNIIIEEALKLVLRNQPFTYIIENRTIIIRKKETKVEEPGVDNALSPPDPIEVRGVITDENGAPAQGVNVMVKGTSKGTTTNLKGEFVLTNVDENAVLLITSVGYDRQEIAIKNKTHITTQLKVAVGNLDEMQVIAYGTTTKRFATGNIATVKAKDIEMQPVNNPLLALQGRVPGLFITQANGLPGTGVTVQIQGRNSIGSGNNPLYIIDGVPYASQMLPTVYAPQFGGFGAGSPFNFINPADIESIDILKDADATAIYGSRAANGAILITTKKGKAGKTKVDINLQSGGGKVTRKLDLLNTPQYLEMRNEALKNDGIASPSASDYDINGVWDTNKNTDWQNTLIGGTAHYTDIQSSVSGGNSNMQFIVGAGYHKETTVFPGNLADQKGSLHFSINNISTNQKFRIQLSGNYLVDKNQLSSTDLTSYATTLPPNAPPLYNEDGSLNWMLNSNGSSTWRNPLSSLSQTYEGKTNNLISNAIISYRVLPELDIRSSFGYTNLQTNEFLGFPLIAERPEDRPFSSRFATYTNAKISSWIIEPQANYKRTIGKAKLDVLVGTTIHQNNNKGDVLGGNGYNSDAVLKDIRSASSVTVNSSVASVYKYNALFGRIIFNFKDKYILNLTARRDGSSRFGSRNQFHNFGSVGVAWIFTQEEFIQKNLSFFSFGKLRGSFGTTGNDQIGDYQFMDLFSPYTDNVGVPYQNTSSLTVNGLPNPYLEWEETRKLQFGIDLGCLKDRILLTANYVRNRSSNQLLAYNLPTITGFGSIIENFPATVQNSAWEFLLNVTTIKGSNITWSSSLNLTLPKNKLKSFPNLATSNYASSLIIGQPINVQKAFHLLGVDPATGVYQFANKDGSATSSPDYSTDRTVIINTLPKFYGGFQNSFRYKGFQLDILFQFVKQIGPNYNFGFILPTGFSGYNQPVSVLNRWQKPGDNRPIQRYSSGFNYFSQHFNAKLNSDESYSDASYIRLKNASLSWQLPEAWRRNIHLQDCRLYIQGQNLLTITHFKGMDPENQSTTSLPPLRVLTIGFQVVL